jgi:hypothetical protein
MRHMTIHSTKGGARALRTLRAGLLLGTTVCLVAATAACDVTYNAAGAQTSAPASAAPAPSATAAGGDAPATPASTIPFEAGHVPEGWAERGAECGMNVSDLVTQDDRFRLQLAGPMTPDAEGALYQQVRLEHEIDDAALDFGTNVQLVWSQGDVVVDLGYGWNEGGGLLLMMPDDEGVPNGEYTDWGKDGATYVIAGLTDVPIATTCWPGDAADGVASYDAPRPDGEYVLRAVVLAMVDGESRLVVSDPVPFEYVGPAVG